MSDYPLPLPPRPNLDWLKNRAKEKLRELRTRRPDAKRTEAQLAVAREYGSPSWRKLRERLKSLAGATDSAARTVLGANSALPHDHPLVAAAVEAIRGGDVNARFEGRHSETPLHWAASSDDVAVLDALLDHGADIEARGGVIGDGTPLADAVAFGQWRAARHLVARGAQLALWQAAALGFLDQVRAHFAGAALRTWTAAGPRPGDPPDEVTHAFWCACHGGQQDVAEYLLARGAIINWVGYDNLTPLGAARRSGADGLAAWLVQRGAK